MFALSRAGYGRSVLMTLREREVLDALVKEGTLKRACAFLDISYDAGSQRLFRVRRKYESALRMVREYERYRLRIQDKTSLYL